jgi:thiamine kinase-like enzyme
LGSFDLLFYCQTYLNGITHKTDSLNRIQHKLKPILDVFIQDKTPHTLCHNDLVPDNCFANAQGSLFIDWEYAQTNNPWFDLAAIIYYCHLNSDQIGLLLTAYQHEQIDHSNTSMLIASQCAVLWCDILWHINRSGHSGLNQKLEQLQSIAVQF